MKKLIFSFIGVLFSLSMLGQDYNVPKNVKLEAKEDYAAYEPQVKETIDWLLNTPLGKDANKRTEANAFLMMWLIGTPNVSMNINADLLTFIKKNPELLMAFTAGSTKYALDNDYSKDMVQAHIAGIESAVNFYRKNRGYLKKDGDIEKYEKLMEKGKLEAEVRKKLDKIKK